MSFVAITSGDVDGVGFEVSAKALALIGPQKNTHFVLYRHESSEKKYLKILDRKFKRLSVISWNQAQLELKKLPVLPKNILIDICHPQQAPLWVEESALLCHQGVFSAMVTAPLSKELVHHVGLKDMGHTGILKRISGSSALNMGFVGASFNVVLATDHIPLKKVPTDLNLRKASSALKSAEQLRLLLPAALRRKPIAFVGLNPHAGENGLIGSEETLWLADFCKKNQLIGPLSPDAAFQKSNWKKFSVYIASYHDQGLIPFKMVHGQDTGFHITLGLNFLRTSVDHGTAKDIFGKNIANPSSMKEAILFTLK